MFMFTRVVFRKLLEPVYRFRPPKNEPKKSSSTLCKSFLFIKEIKGHFYQRSFLLCENYRKLGLSNAYLRIKHSMAEEKTEISWKNMQQLPKPWCAFLSNMQQVTIRKQLKNSLYVVQNYRFQFKTVIGEKDGL